MYHMRFYHHMHQRADVGRKAYSLRVNQNSKDECYHKGLHYPTSTCSRDCIVVRTHGTSQKSATELKMLRRMQRTNNQDANCYIL